MTGEISAAGAILTIAGFQEWHADKLFGSCKPCSETRDPEPIKVLMQEMMKLSNPLPWLQVSIKTADTRDKVTQCLHACYFSADEIEQWFAIVDDQESNDDEKEERLEELLLEKFDDLNLEYVHLVCKDFQGKWGDRRQEIVFIGENVDSEGLTKTLDACLINDEEMVQWEQVMENDTLDKKAVKMLKHAQHKLEILKVKNAPLKALERAEDKIAEAEFYVAEAKAEKLQDLWNDNWWAEWFIPADGHDHEYDHEHEDSVRTAHNDS